MPSENRPDPDALLASVQRAARGKLKIFLGAAPGVGKTWEMLAAAAHKRETGVDVVAGIIETHGRAGTEEKLLGLEVLPRIKIPYRGQVLEEFDLDAALARRPALLLVDELAHTNAPGLRHAKRWQDVEELLGAGINIWTTVNVQHLENLNDQVARITGIRVTETVPDSVLDMADEIELIDLPPAELRARLAEGRIYRPEVADRALKEFFREGNLGALREMALRRAAQRVDKDITTYMRARAIPGPWPAAERVLALIGPDVSANNVVRHAARLADALRAPLIAFHVERADDNANVQTALDLAVQLGGTAATVAAPDVRKAVLAYAAEHNVTHIVAGRGPRLGAYLQKHAVAFTLHFVPVPAAPAQRAAAAPAPLAWTSYAAAAAALGVATLAGTAFATMLPDQAVALIYTAIIAGAASRFGRNVGLATATLAFLAWDFFFIPPLYTFTVGSPRDLITLGIFLASGLVTGQLAGRVRGEAEAATARIEALRRISLLGQRFAPATTQTDILDIAASEAAAMTSAAIMLLPSPGGLTPAAAVPAGSTLDNAAFAAASWAEAHKTETGIGTATLPSIAWWFLPLAVNGEVLGVLGVLPKTLPLPPLVQSLRVLADQAAMALARVRLTITTVKIEARQDNQKLRTALLSSLSHDLRTPLTGIRGAAEVLAQGDGLDPAIQADLLASIVQDTERMTKFLGNIMEMARVETGEISARRERLLLTDSIEAAIARIPAAMYAGINILPPASYVLGDPTLLEQVLVNILDNATKYAPEGSRISITAARAGGNVVIKIADEGVGIPAAELGHVFDSFFRATRGDRVAPGTGLGLAIAKAFTEAMGGSISATSPRLDLPADGLPGTVISVTLPAA